MTYTVKDGDNLWGIAKAQLGRSSRYTKIVKLNKIKTATLSSGQQITLPRK